MPLFEYQCKNCGRVTTFLESAGKRKDHPCESCGSGNTKRLFSTFAAHAHGAPLRPERCKSCTADSCPMAS
jgi:putative FmdB family regulatory protein